MSWEYRRTILCLDLGGTFCSIFRHLNSHRPANTRLSGDLPPSEPGEGEDKHKRTDIENIHKDNLKTDFFGYPQVLLRSHYRHLQLALPLRRSAAAAARFGQPRRRGDAAGCRTRGHISVGGSRRRRRRWSACCSTTCVSPTKKTVNANNSAGYGVV